METNIIEERQPFDIGIINDNEFFILTNYRDDFGQIIWVQNYISRKTLENITANFNSALANNVSTKQKQQCNIGAVSYLLPDGKCNYTGNMCGGSYNKDAPICQKCKGQL